MQVAYRKYFHAYDYITFFAFLANDFAKVVFLRVNVSKRRRIENRAASSVVVVVAIGINAFAVRRDKYIRRYGNRRDYRNATGKGSKKIFVNRSKPA